MKNFTDITVLMDRSGSMARIKESMETAYNNFLKEHKDTPSTRITLIQFDDINDQDIVYQNVPVGAADPLRLRPRGNTPLLDAMVKAIDGTGRRLASMDERDRPDQVLMVIITDGEENMSRTYNRKNVSDRVRHQRENYRWQFVYLGANQDAIQEAQSFAIPHTHAINYSHDSQGVTASSGTLSGHTHTYVSNTSRGTDMPEFTKEERTKADKNWNNSGGSHTHGKV